MEAGDEEPEITSIPGFMTQLPESNLSWKFEAQSEKINNFPNEKIAWPCGKVRTFINCDKFIIILLI